MLPRSVFQVGSRRVEAVSDGWVTLRDGFMNVPDYQRNFEDASGVAALPIASFVVFGETLVLLDAGYGPHQSRNLSGGALLDELESIGVRPHDVDVVALSHLHLDHDGWLATAEAEAVFSRATFYVGRGDFEMFVREDVPVNPRFTMAPALKEALTRLHDDGRVFLVDDALELAPGVVALPTPGHTPGHLAFSVRDGGEQLLVLGDAMYCPAQLTDADLTAMHDVDPALARRSRELIQREVEAHGTSAIGCHFPGLQAARVVSSEVVVVG